MPVVKDVDGHDLWVFGVGDICISNSVDGPPYELIFDCVDHPHGIGSPDDRGEQSTSELKKVVRMAFCDPSSLAVLISQAGELLLKMTTAKRTAEEPE